MLIQGCAISKSVKENKPVLNYNQISDLNKSKIDINSLSNFRQTNDAVRYITYSTIRRIGLNKTAEFIEACSDCAVEQVIEPADEFRTIKTKTYKMKFSLDMDKQDERIFFCIIISW